MIDLNEIQKEIDVLEQGDTSYANCSKLAVLYSIRSNFKGSYNLAHSFGQSEFLQACSNANIEDVMNVLDEHMECIKALYPREYNQIIKKIRG